MSTWNTSNYRQRKAARQAAKPAHWITNPDTQESFFIRPLNPASIALAGYLPGILRQAAVTEWQKRGIAPEGEPEIEEVEASTEVDRNNRTNAKLVYEACLIPTLTAIGEDSQSIQERALRNCEAAFSAEEEWKAASAEIKLQRAAEVVLPMEDLDESDAMFLLRHSYSYGEKIPMQGGRVMNMADLKSLRKKPGRRSRTGTSG